MSAPRSPLMLAAVARWIASSERSIVPPIRIAIGAIGSMASSCKPASRRGASGAARGPRRRAVRVTSMAASRLDTRRGQRTSSCRSALVSGSRAISLTSAEESRYATGALLVATLDGVVRLRAALVLEGDRCGRAGPKVQRLDFEEIAVCVAHGQLGQRTAVEWGGMRGIRGHRAQYDGGPAGLREPGRFSERGLLVRVWYVSLQRGASWAFGPVPYALF